jgi:muramoyltetrapeptide carboxypeptidase
MNCQMPPPLKPGDVLKVITPSGALREIEAFEKGVEIWRSHGYKVEVSESVKDRFGYLAGTDSDRTNQLLEAWNDPKCKGILCARGGYGSARILENWSWGNSHKWLIGFSDITCLLWSLYKQGKSSVHGAVLTTLATEPDWSIERLFNLVEGRPLAPLQGIGWGGGIATGILLPANLTVATHLLGTPLQPNLDGVILALEDVTEAPYRIDRLLTQWRLSGVLTKVRGIALGRFSRCVAPSNIPSMTIEEVLRDRLSDLNIPIVSNLPFGHDGCNAALPVGFPATLDAEQGTLAV